MSIKIVEINPKNNIKKPKSQKPVCKKVVSISFEPLDKSASSKIEANPLYYQSVYGINAPVIKVEDSHLRLKTSTIAKYLMNIDGNIDKDLVRKFSNLYYKNFEEIKSKTPPDDEKIICRTRVYYSKALHTNHRTGKSTPLTREILANVCVSNNEGVKRAAYKKTTREFELSRTNNGYDFSDMYKKSEFLDKFNDLEKCYNIPNNYLFNEFSRIARNKDGKFDVDFAQRICNILLSQDSFLEPKMVAAILRNLINKDPKNKDKIYYAVDMMQASYFDMYELEYSFEDLLDLCFDKNNKYNDKNAKSLFLATDKVGRWLDRRNYIDGKNKHLTIQQKNIRHKERLMYGAYMVLEYISLLEQAKENSTEKPDIDEYISSKSKNMLFMC